VFLKIKGIIFPFNGRDLFYAFFLESFAAVDASQVRSLIFIAGFDPDKCLMAGSDPSKDRFYEIIVSSLSVFSS